MSPGWRWETGELARGGPRCGAARVRRSARALRALSLARMPLHLKTVSGRIRCAYFFGAKTDSGIIVGARCGRRHGGRLLVSSVGHNSRTIDTNLAPSYCSRQDARRAPVWRTPRRRLEHAWSYCRFRSVDVVFPPAIVTE